MINCLLFMEAHFCADVEILFLHKCVINVSGFVGQYFHNAFIASVSGFWVKLSK